ncbi:hypothetical protein BGZ61DRAFT_456240 [Ilyonectria robusta]|uniref:uncharacterized protein n=1 Tax=Ilyonectria robusta TaxID=1079257 RepID=UPI001E8D5B12|nr:uncharacterized protein BGZ61DRAFT_456240 [Ilyonectria robusta]KAH8683737.1 hypothetical protein BGZ61DRAFT_456240 [Ilyonectria robusta]
MALTKFTLYHNTYSVCSIMVRMTLAFRGAPKDDASAMDVEERIVDIFHEEQLSEEFLCTVNELGQVPVLASSNLPENIKDSLDITHFIAKSYPSLIPATHSEQITRLLFKLHDMNYFSLSFAGRPIVAASIVAGVEKRLQQTDNSERYRKALESKLDMVNRNKVGGLRPEITMQMSERATALMHEIDALLPEKGIDGQAGPWLFGLQQPTALDAHLIVFIARMRDVNRLELIPDKLQRYAEEATRTVEWKQVMFTRRTMAPHHGK